MNRLSQNFLSRLPESFVTLVLVYTVATSSLTSGAQERKREAIVIKEFLSVQKVICQVVINFYVMKGINQCFGALKIAVLIEKNHAAEGHIYSPIIGGKKKPRITTYEPW